MTDKQGLFLIVFVLVSYAAGVFVGVRLGIRNAPPCECPEPPPAPFCQYLGSPVGGRLHQLPEGGGPHD